MKDEKIKAHSEFTEGLKLGIPIALGYLSVSFTIGMTAVSAGIPVLSAVLMSMINLTSAGEASGITTMAVLGSFTELVLCQIVINLRYALMSLTISQRLDKSVTSLGRLFISFGITDEIFAVIASRNKLLKVEFFTGLLFLPFWGWTIGTGLGALFGRILPENISAVMSIALYGMFIAIIVPPAKHNKSVFCAISIAAVLSSIIYFVPALDFISAGISVIICAVVASVICAWKFPIAVQNSDGSGEEAE